jgi:hypothetical protein
MYNLDELLAELTAMNGNAKALLEKYDNAGVKLDTKVEELLLAIANAGENVLSAISTILESGNVGGILGYSRDGYKENTTTISSVIPYDIGLRVKIIPKDLDQEIKINWEWSFADSTNATAQSHYIDISKDDGVTWTQLGKWANHIEHQYNGSITNHAISSLHYSNKVSVLCDDLIETTELLFRVRVGTQNNNESWLLNNTIGGDLYAQGQETFLEAMLINKNIVN